MKCFVKLKCLFILKKKTVRYLDNFELLLFFAVKAQKNSDQSEQKMNLEN